MIGLNLFGLLGLLILEEQNHALQNLSKFITIQARPLHRHWMVSFHIIVSLCTISHSASDV
jgi:hypothetical protein